MTQQALMRPSYLDNGNRHAHGCRMRSIAGVCSELYIGIAPRSPAHLTDPPLTREVRTPPLYLALRPEQGFLDLLRHRTLAKPLIKECQHQVVMSRRDHDGFFRIAPDVFANYTDRRRSENGSQGRFATSLEDVSVSRGHRRNPYCSSLVIQFSTIVMVAADRRWRPSAVRGTDRDADLGSTAREVRCRRDVVRHRVQNWFRSAHRRPSNRCSSRRRRAACRSRSIAETNRRPPR